MKQWIGIAICCVCAVLAVAYFALRDTEERFVPPVALERIDGSVLIGIRNTPDGRFHIWTYDIASSKFDVLASDDYDGRYPGLVPGITATQIVWYWELRDEDGLIAGFENFMADTKRKEPVSIDFIKRSVGEGEPHTFAVVKCLLGNGRYMLVDESPEYHVWDISKESHIKTLPMGDGFLCMTANSASGIGEGFGVVVEWGYFGEQDGRSRLVLFDVASASEPRSLEVAGVDLLYAIDAPASECIFVMVRSSCCHDWGYLQVDAGDWDADRALDSEDVQWFPDDVGNMRWANGHRFWVTDYGQGEQLVLNMESETGAEPRYASIRFENVIDPDSSLDYVVSDDATLVATTIPGSETFEVRSISLPEVTLVKRCRVEAREQTDGSFALSLVEE